MATLPPIIDPQLEEEQNRRYFEAALRGRTGARLAQEAGINVPRGTIPPTVTPAPVPPPGPTQWTPRATMAPGTEELVPNMEVFSQLPVGQATAAINAAMQYQGQRGYQQDLQRGVSQAEALSKWAPMMFRNTAGLPSLLKATAPQTAPADSGEWITREISPGVTLARAPGAKTTTLIKSPNISLTEKERQSQLANIAKQWANLYNLDETSPEYQRATNILSGLEVQASPRAGAGGTPAPVVPPPVAAPALAPEVQGTRANPIKLDLSDRAKAVEQFRGLKSGTFYIGPSGLARKP